MTLQPHQPGIPLPHPTPLSAPFWEGCARHELLFQRCASCAAANFDPAPACRSCGAVDLRWVPSSGRGVVESWSVVWRPQMPAFAAPYAVAIVALDEGYAMVSNIIGCDADDVAVGQRVVVEFHPAGEGIVLPYFRPDV